MKSIRTPKRIYTQQALEVWFERLSSDWEHYFSIPILKSAQELYLQGEVREIELSLKVAIIHCRRKKLDIYSMIEWGNGRPAIRTSTEDLQFGRYLAVAGLYEMEELLGKMELPHAVGPYKTARYSLLAVEPVSGRRHQIRRHMNHFSHPVVGDSEHGEACQNRLFREVLDIDRLMLHAEWVAFPHPWNEEQVQINSPAPTEFEKLFPSFDYSPPA